MRNSHLSTYLAIAIWAVSLLIGHAAPAQEDPFGAAPRPPGEGAPPAAAAPRRPEDATQREPLAVELLRASNPTTPRELLQAAQSALQFGRADESKRYLAKLLSDKQADEVLAPLTARYSDFLMELGRTAAVQPEGRQVSNLIFSAAQHITRNLERINAAIVQLSDAHPGTRQEALGKLAEAGTAAVNPMLRALADVSRQTEHSNIRTALVQLGGTTELPLIGALDTPDAALKTQLASILGRIGSTRAAAHLIRPLFDPSSPAELREISAAALQRVRGAVPDAYEGEKYLTAQIRRSMSGDVPYERDADDRVRLWSWDEAQHAVTSTLWSRQDAGVLLAAKLATDLYVIKPRDAAVMRLMLLTNLEWDKVEAGLDRPLPVGGGSAGAKALSAGPQLINQVLADALRQGRVPAATAAAEVLAQCGDPSVLHSPGGVATPLADAITFPDRRVRLAAALAAVKLAPGESFPGAGRIPETLAWFVETSGADVVFVGHPRGEDAQSLVGFLNALGYDGEGAYVGRGQAERAFISPDFQFILIADSIDRPPVEELAQWLRRDSRTARLPIGVMARGERFESLRESLRDDPFVTVFPRIHSIDVAALEIQKLSKIAGRNYVPRDERLLQAKSALAAFTTLAKNPTALAQYELLRQEPTIIRALNNPTLIKDAAALLGLFGTPQAQAALIDFANQTNRPLADREAAAAAFVAAAESHGVRLTPRQIGQQYARLESVQSLDEETQKLIGSVVAAIKASAVARGELIKP